MSEAAAAPRGWRAFPGIFIVFLRLGLTAFGGPVAHLAYFHAELVRRRKWLAEAAYADLVALCQFLPGPASSQVGMAIGLVRGGYPGAFAAWLGFTLPSALAMLSAGVGLARFHDRIPPGALHGAKAVAVAVVAHAAWGMAKPHLRDARRMALVAVCAGATLAFPLVPVHAALLVGAAAIGFFWIRPTGLPSAEPLPHGLRRRDAVGFLVAHGAMLIVLPVLAAGFPRGGMPMVDTMYRTGSLVFGGGHVVLPLLRAAVVPRGWIDGDVFLAGYAAAQAVPGPLFSFAAFLGATMKEGPTGWIGGVVALVAMFLPGFAVVAGALPFWERLRVHARAQSAIAGANTAVVGMLVATLVHPIGSSTVHGGWDVVVLVAAGIALGTARMPVWSIVLLGGLLGAGVEAIRR
ncbi:MAG: chromate efflux transporter [Armatimonadota bacterium]